MVSVCGRLLHLDPWQVFTRISMKLHLKSGRDPSINPKGMTRSSLRHDADGILIFVRVKFLSYLHPNSTPCRIDWSFLFYGGQLHLQDSSGDATVQIVTQISGQLAAIPNGTIISVPPPLSQFRPMSGSVCVNTLWFLSLCLSLTYVLALPRRADSGSGSTVHPSDRRVQRDDESAPRGHKHSGPG